MMNNKNNKYPDGYMPKIEYYLVLTANLIHQHRLAYMVGDCEFADELYDQYKTAHEKLTWAIDKHNTLLSGKSYEWGLQ
jgi:hypothetical protein